MSEYCNIASLGNHLIEAIKEQQGTIEDLKFRVEQLEKN